MGNSRLSAIYFIFAFIMSCQVCAETTVVIKANQDVYIRKNYPTSNFDYKPEGTEFGAKYGTGGVYRSLMNWDLSSIPNNAQVVSAILILHVGKKVCAGDNCLPEGDLDIYRVLAQWEEIQATWTNRLNGIAWQASGSDYDPTRAATAHVVGTGDYTFNVTALASGWVSGQYGQYGVFGEIRNHSNTTVWVGGAHNSGAWFPPADLEITYDAGSTGINSYPNNRLALPVLNVHPNPIDGQTFIIVGNCKANWWGIYNILGRLVYSDSPEHNSGIVKWDGRDGSGYSVPGGQYLLAVKGEKDFLSKRITIK